MPTIKPYQTVDETDVINLYAFSGVLPVNKGTFVKVISGWLPTQNLESLGSPGATYGNTVSLRYGVMPKCGKVTSSGDVTIGMLLYDVRNVDENGELLIFKPQKAAEMEVAISGQAVPIATKGVFLYSGVQGNPTAGAAAYVDSNANLNVTGGGSTRVGTFLGPAEAGLVLFRLNVS